MVNRFLTWDGLVEQPAQWAISLKRIFNAIINSAEGGSAALRTTAAFRHGLEDAQSGILKKNPYHSSTERHRDYNAAYEYQDWAERNMW